MPQYLALHILFIVLTLTADDMTVLHVGAMAEVCGLVNHWTHNGELVKLIPVALRPLHHPPPKPARLKGRIWMNQTPAVVTSPPFVMPADPPSGHAVSSLGVKFTFIGTVSGSFLNVTFQFIIVIYMYICTYAHWLN